MSEQKAYLPLYLDAPLQSWGYQSRFDRRTTLSYPTRSGILGMICAARGNDWSDTDALRELDVLSMTVLVFQQGGRLTDFHTVGGGYDRDRQKLFIPHTAQDELRSPGKETVPTHREYLEQSKFGVVLGGPRKLIEAIHYALVDPVWGIWLGRKACIPALPVCVNGPSRSEGDAEAALRKRAGNRSVRRRIREVPFAEGTDTLPDRPVSFDPNDRKFAPRRVAVEEGPDADLRETTS